MTECSKDPFKRVSNTSKLPNRLPDLDDYKVRGIGGMPFVQFTTLIINQTNKRIATYNHLGLRTIIPKDPEALNGVVRVQMSFTTNGTLIDYSSMGHLMHLLSDAQVESIYSFLKALDQDTTRNLVLFWDIPLDELRHNPNGVSIEALGLVVQLDDPALETTDLIRADTRYIAAPDKLTGLTAHFNKIDRTVHGIWINIKGTTPLKLCSNQCDPNLPEGLTVVMNGEQQTYTLDEMALNGFYMSAATASTSHTVTAAEANTVHKQYIQENKESIERQAKEEDRRYERTVKEEDKQWDRSFKEKERDVKLEDKQYDREQVIIDKAPQRSVAWTMQRLGVISAVVVLASSLIKVGLEVKKTYDQHKGD